MPGPDEQPYGARAWWRDPLPPEEPDEPAAPADGSAEQPANPSTSPSPNPSTNPSPQASGGGPHGPVPAAYDTGAPAGYDFGTPTPRDAAPAGPERQDGAGPGGAGPADATVLMAPVPDATQVLPPVPPGPADFLPGSAPTVAPGPAQGPVRGMGPVQGRGAVRGTPAGPPVPPPGYGDGGFPPVPHPSAAETQVYAPITVGDGAPGGRGSGPRLRLGGTDRDRRATLVTLGGVLLALVLVISGAALLVSRLRNTPPSATPGASVTAVDLTTVHATASSEQKADGTITYTAGNTLDGNLATAWNSNGTADGPGPGITMTYRFATPVDLRTITIRNGYQKVRPNGIDLWERNERVKQLEVITQTGHWTWDLADVRDPQTLAKTFGRTSTVELRILQVYPGTRYRDVAVSEIAFGAAAS